MASLCILLSLCYDDEFKVKRSDETYGPIPHDARLTPTGNPLDVLDTRMKASPGPDPLWYVYENNLQSRKQYGTIDKLKERHDQDEFYELFASPAPDADDVQFTNDAFGGQNWEEFGAKHDWGRGILHSLPMIVENLKNQNVLADNLTKNWQILVYVVKFNETNALKDTLMRVNQFKTLVYVESVDGPCALFVFVFAFTLGLFARFSCKQVPPVRRESEKIISGV
jgi:hypothetical protein